MTLVFQTGIDLRADLSRVVTRFFVPGREDVGPGNSRATPVLDRVLALSEEAVEKTLSDLIESFSDRHADLVAVFTHHADQVMSRVDTDQIVSPARRLLIGATFTHEYSIEGAALCNPSAVLHPVQPDDGSVAFIMSVRGVGEGHRSSVGFREGSLSVNGDVTLKKATRHPVLGSVSEGQLDRRVFKQRLLDLADDDENSVHALANFAERFTHQELTDVINALTAERSTRRKTSTTITNLRDLAESFYRVGFPAASQISQRVLWPHSPDESHGIEDARFVRFIEDDGTVVYYATATAFDGINVSQHLLETTDFAAFRVSPLVGEVSIGKGIAIFPRRINGMYAALTRSDRETNSVAFTDNVNCWTTAESVQFPVEPWEILQLGNCGSPIETPRGWLCITHGVGPLRTYALGAILLDLEDPRKVVARLRQPLLVPQVTRRNGYVPNVVYSCGGFAHGDLLVLPYGVADQSISVISASLDGVLASMEPV